MSAPIEGGQQPQWPRRPPTHPTARGAQLAVRAPDLREPHDPVLADAGDNFHDTSCRGVIISLIPAADNASLVLHVTRVDEHVHLDQQLLQGTHHRLGQVRLVKSHQSQLGVINFTKFKLQLLKIAVTW